MWILGLFRKWFVGRRPPAEVTNARFNDPWAERAIQDFEDEMGRS
jgi:hypothetical protein